jgi:hypothetical protein
MEPSRRPHSSARVWLLRPAAALALLGAAGAAPQAPTVPPTAPYQVSITNFVELRRKAATPEARRGQRVLIGPWAHAGTSPEGKVGDITFGKAAVPHPNRFVRDWYDYLFAATSRASTATSTPARRTSAAAPVAEALPLRESRRRVRPPTTTPTTPRRWSCRWSRGEFEGIETSSSCFSNRERRSVSAPMRDAGAGVGASAGGSGAR